MNKISRQYHKALFYLSNALQFFLVPRRCYRNCLRRKLAQLTELTPENRSDVIDRVNYYNKLTDDFHVGPGGILNSSLRPGEKNTYIFDTYRTLRYFDPSLKFDYIFGDVRTIPDFPKVVKSRPIDGANKNSVLLKLNEVRHFYFVQRDIPFAQKKNMVVWRGSRGNKKARIELLERHGNNPLCDIGYSKTREHNHPNYKGFLSIQEQLKFKFILSIEGNDVASNLKWILSSNSLCLMPKPRFETWFMEGRLKANYHYVLLNDDCSDLDEKVFYYTKNIDEAQRIIQNANRFVEPFKDKSREELISLLVMHKYFQLSGQIHELTNFWTAK